MTIADPLGKSYKDYREEYVIKILVGNNTDPSNPECPIDIDILPYPRYDDVGLMDDIENAFNAYFFKHCSGSWDFFEDDYL